MVSLKDRRKRQSIHKPLRYSVSKQIASGGFSDVFLGLSHDTGELICVKQLKTGFAEFDMAAMETEVSLLKRLAHPNIVQYLGTDRGERFTILLGYVPGGSIALLLLEFGALEEELVTLYVRQAVWGLQYLHSEGIVHGDIKGANILVSDKGEVRLTDFGCSYCSRSADANCLVMGTVLWMAPEVCRQEGSNYSSDIWSLGCTILQMATNKEPWSEKQFEHTTPAFYHIATCQQPPQVPETLCIPMQDVVRQCLQLQASGRPTCDDLLVTSWLALDVDGAEDQDCWHTPMGSPRWSRLQAARTPRIVQPNAPRSQGNSHGDLPKNVLPFPPLPGEIPASRSVSPRSFWPPLGTPISEDLLSQLQPASARPRAVAMDLGTTSYLVPGTEGGTMPDTHQSRTEDPAEQWPQTPHRRPAAVSHICPLPAPAYAVPTTPRSMTQSLSGSLPSSSTTPHLRSSSNEGALPSLSHLRLPECTVRQSTLATEQSITTAQSHGMPGQGGSSTWKDKFAQQLKFLQITAEDWEEPLQAVLHAPRISPSVHSSSSGFLTHHSGYSAPFCLADGVSVRSTESRGGQSGDHGRPMLRHSPALRNPASRTADNMQNLEADVASRSVGGHPSARSAN